MVRCVMLMFGFAETDTKGFKGESSVTKATNDL